MKKEGHIQKNMLSLTNNILYATIKTYLRVYLGINFPSDKGQLEIN